MSEGKIDAQILLSLHHFAKHILITCIIKENLMCRLLIKYQVITLSIHYNGGKIDSDKHTLLLIHHLIFAKITMEEELVLIQIVYLGNAIQFTALHKEYLGLLE